MPFEKGNKLHKQRRDLQSSSLLLAMRKVFGQPKEKDKGYEQQTCRGLLEANPEGFLDRLQKLEADQTKAFGDMRPSDDDKAEVAMDAGTQRCVELAEKLLLETKDELSRCPNCGHQGIIGHSQG